MLILAFLYTLPIVKTIGCLMEVRPDEMNGLVTAHTCPNLRQIRN